ncbi:hypothetical protein LJR225_001485 [Phenylobacterium sp. LjRoot225]|uniref:hypothetical protein n=1 Tax=Phenylobacterium sp. LjRoot225 TaxID=3342285 RepID=UPI003ECF1CF9
MRFTMTLAVAAAALATALPAMAQTTAPSTADPAASSPSASESGSAASTTAATPTLSIGQPVKDKTGVVIGQIADLKPGAAGQTATVKMGEQSFSIGAESFVVQDGAAVINATQAELKSMIANAAKPG